MPNNYLIGIGRVDVAPKYQAVELVVFTAATWAGAKLAGIDGVAAVAAVRLAAFSVYLLAVSFTAGGVPFGYVWKNGFAGVLAALALLAAGLAASTALGGGVWGAGALLAVFAAAAWARVLTADERAFLAGLLKRPRPSPEAAA